MIDYRDDARWTVYIHIVPKEISGYGHDKYYVGITSQKNPSYRWGKNGARYDERHPYFRRAIDKYGWNNMQHEIIANHLTKSEACDMEKTLIKELQSNNNEYGYNCTNGGEGTSGYKPSAESLKKMSESKMGHVVTPETIDIVRKKNKGIKVSEEVKLQRIKNHPDQSYGNNPFAKEIYQFSLDGNFIRKFSAIAEARDLLNLNSNSISRSTRSHKPYKDYYWESKENVIEVNGEYKIIHKQEINENNIGKKREVFQFALDGNFINSYNSIAEASKHSNDSYISIFNDINNKSTKCVNRSFIWRIESDIIIKEDGEICLKQEELDAISVFQFDINGLFIKQYSTLKDCCEVNDYNIYIIRKNLNNKSKTAYGYIWKYKRDVEESAENTGSFFY